ncbi:MAG: peptidoglycan-binding protein [Xanthobacteraceae bacterium]
MAEGERFEHGSVLGGKTRADWVSSQWKSTGRVLPQMQKQFKPPAPGIPPSAQASPAPNLHPDISVSGPTFDCAKARSSLAVLICSDSDAARADWELVIASWARYFSLSEIERPKFSRDQDQWFASVGRKCKLAGQRPPYPREQISCVVGAYKARAAAYRSKLTGDALAESKLSQEQLVRIQKALITGGYLNDDADGEFGPATRSAIRQYQQAHGIPQSGYLSVSQRQALLAESVGSTHRTAADEIPPPTLDDTARFQRPAPKVAQQQIPSATPKEQAEMRRAQGEEEVHRNDEQLSTKEAEEAQRSRQEAEQRLAEIKRRIEAKESANPGGAEEQAAAPKQPPQPKTAQQEAEDKGKSVQWETLSVRIGAFHEAFNRIAQGGTTDLLAEPARCGRGACFYQLTDFDGSVASKVIVAAGPPENNASSIELQASNTLAQNTLGAAVITTVQIAAPQLSVAGRLHVMRSLFADMANPHTIGPGGAACVDLVPGHWIISGYVFDYIVHIRIQWPSSSPRGQAGKCRHLVPDDEVPAADRFLPYKAQQTINDCGRDAACWVRHYPEVPSWCLSALFERSDLQALSVAEVNAVDQTPREIRWADNNQAWVFAFNGRYPKRAQPFRCNDPFLAGCSIPPLVMVEYSCTYDPMTQKVLDVRLLPNAKPVSVPSPTVDYFLPRGAHR